VSRIFNGPEREAKTRLRQQLAALPDVEPSTMQLVDVREALPLESDDPPAPPDPTQPLEPAPVPRQEGRRRRPIRFLVRLVGLALIATVGVAAYHWYGIERVDLADALATTNGTGTNILLVGTDSRAGLSATGEADAYGLGISGERTDTLLILNVSDRSNRLLSIPRDLYISAPGGEQMRINAALGAGPDQLVAAITAALAIPVHHYAEVDFASFLEIVDAIGSVPVDIAHPAYDDRSGFQSDRAGTIRLDAEQSLAFVRSRSYTEVIGGVPTTDGSGDFGRTERQRTYLRALVDELFAVRNPVTAVRVGGAVRTSLIIDESTSIFDAVRLTLELRNLGGVDAPGSAILPVTPTTIDGAAVLLLDESRADTVLSAFRSS